MTRILVITVLVAFGAVAGGNATEAKGCIKGAIVGGAAGSLAGHGKAGAAAGCAVGHNEANKKDQSGGNGGQKGKPSQ